MRVWKALSDSGWPRLNGKELSVIKASVTGRGRGGEGEGERARERGGERQHTHSVSSSEVSKSHGAQISHGEVDKRPNHSAGSVWPFISLTDAHSLLTLNINGRNVLQSKQKIKT